jgi:hypothetical protein
MLLQVLLLLLHCAASLQQQLLLLLWSRQTAACATTGPLLPHLPHLLLLLPLHLLPADLPLHVVYVQQCLARHCAVSATLGAPISCCRCEQEPHEGCEEQPQLACYCWGLA